MGKHRNKSRSPDRERPGDGGDTLASNDILNETVRAVLAKVKVDRRHDVPYLGGCSRDGRTVYIDRHLPKVFLSAGRRVDPLPFLVLHEAVEKSLLMHLGLRYQYAHQLALRAEQAAVRAAGISWHDYNRFCQAHVKDADDERISRPPVDLDTKPYRDETDRAKLRSLRQAILRERTTKRR